VGECTKRTDPKPHVVELVEEASGPREKPASVPGKRKGGCLEVKKDKAWENSIAIQIEN